MTAQGETTPEAPAAAAERAKTKPRCEVCRKSFRTHFSLNVHRKSKCGQVRPGPAEPAEGATYTCSVCKGAYPGAEALLQHLQSHLSVDSEGAAPALACTERGRECASPEDLAQHVRAHGEDLVQDADDAETDEEAVDAETDEDAVDAETDEDAVDAETDEDAVDAETDEDADDAETDEDAVDAETDENADDAETDEDAVDAESDEDAVDDQTEEHSMDCGDSSADGDGDEDSVNGDSAVDQPPRPPPRPQDSEAGAGAGFSCRHCGRVFGLLRICRRHETSHFPGCYPCSECGKTFGSKPGLAVHRNSCARGGCARTRPLVKAAGPKPTVAKSAVSKTTVPKPTVPKPAVPTDKRCPICARAFTYTACLRTHQLKCTPRSKAPRPRVPKLSGQPKPPPQPGLSAQPKLPLQPRQTNSAENVQAKAPSSRNCKLCRRDAESFPKFNRLCPHRASMHKPRPFHCTFCPWSFQSVNHLKDHLMLHIGVKPFECSVCNKKFTSKRFCRKHEQTHQRGLTE